MNWRPHRLTFTDSLVAVSIFGGTLALLLATMQMGFTRDESFYFHAAYDYIRWFEELWKNWQAGDPWASFTQASVDRHWGYNPEHPVLMKTAFALSFKLFHEILGWTSASTAMRLPGALTGAMTVAFTYLFGRQLFGRIAGIIAAGAILFQPRFFFHAHLACFDVPVTAFWLAVVYAYWRSFQSRGWAIGTGILWGLALSVKLNAFFLPAVLGLHWLLMNWRGFGLKRGEGGWRVRIPPFPLAFLSMAVFGPILFYGLWPRHWFDTWERVQWYLNFHLKHVHYFVYYLGENIQWPPLPVSYPWFMTLVTVPATILLGAGAGVVYWWLRAGGIQRFGQWYDALRERRLPEAPRPDPRGTGLLFAINILFSLALISMPETPIFGGTKHWMQAMPFVAILCAGGVVWSAVSAAEVLSRPGWGRALHLGRPGRQALVAAVLTLALGACVLAPAVYSTAENHPFGTSYYNELIGSYRGAADARMMRQYWGYASRQALPWLNENAPENGSVWTHNTTGYAWKMYETDGLARKDLRPGSLARSQYALFHYQKAFVYQLVDLWDYYETRTPVHVVGIDGVPVLAVYEKPGVVRRAPPEKAGRESDVPSKNVGIDE